MAFRTAVAAALFLAVFVTQHAPAGAQGGQGTPAAPVGAQGRGGAGAPGRGGPGSAFGAGPFTPAAGAKDLKSVLFNWTWRMGASALTDALAERLAETTTIYGRDPAIYAGKGDEAGGQSGQETKGQGRIGV